MVCGTPSHAPQISRQRWSCLDIFKRRSTDDKIVLVIFVIVAHQIYNLSSIIGLV